MHDAPSVSYPVGRCRFAGAAMAALWLLGAAAVGGWAWQSATGGWVLGAPIAVWCASGVLAARAWWHSPAGALAWDGAGWSWAGDSLGPARPRVALDLQRWLLLSLDGERGVAWLWLERDGDPRHWDALRRAVYSRASTAAPQGAQLPVAKT